MESLFGLMNFLPVMGKDSFSEMNKDIAVSYSKIAKDCMVEAANEVHFGGDVILQCHVMVHGRRDDFLHFWELSA